jgi:DNA-directed RNA polymerase subunit M/transcription elongation factor TFIIS
MSTMTKCPNCSKVLKLKSEAAFGKKVACPQCQEPFTVKPFKKKAKSVVEEP